MAKKNKALVIDPCISEEALRYLLEQQVEYIQILLTHEHYDHISGVNWFRVHFENVHVMCSQACAEALPNPHKNLAAFSAAMYMDKSLDKSLEEYGWEEDYICYEDETFTDEYTFDWQGHHFYLKETPGHSKGSICILLDDQCLFSGDSLVTGHPTITRLPGGSKKTYERVVIPFLKQLNPELLVYPGHGEPQQLMQFEL